MIARLQTRIQTVKISAEVAPEAALFVSTLLTPAAVLAFVLAIWRLGNDINLTGEFAISSGLFSHWQVWLAVGVLLRAGSAILKQISRENA